MNRRTSSFLAAVIAVASMPAAAQWLNYPTAGVPRLPNGQPNLAAPAPKTADGKPDLSGLWETNREGGPGSSFTGVRFPALFMNIGAQLKDGLPYRPWARDLAKARQADNSKDIPDAKCLPLGILLLHSHVFPRKILQLPSLVVALH